jgi:hypothetical protein
MANIFKDTVAKRAYLLASISSGIGVLLLFFPDTSYVHGEGIITLLGGLFLIGLSILGLLLFLVLRILSK